MVRLEFVLDLNQWNFTNFWTIFILLMIRIAQLCVHEQAHIWVGHTYACTRCMYMSVYTYKYVY